jgi:hypothetical protein
LEESTGEEGSEGDEDAQSNQRMINFDAPGGILLGGGEVKWMPKEGIEVSPARVPKNEPQKYPSGK